MTKLVVDGSERTDGWDHLAGGEAPAGRDFTVSIVRWLEQRSNLVAHVERTGAVAGGPSRDRQRTDELGGTTSSASP